MANSGLVSASQQCTSPHGFVCSATLTQSKLTVLPQGLYSPNLAPCNYFLFPKIKIQLRDKHSRILQRFYLNHRWCSKASQKEVPEMLPVVGEALDLVYESEVD
jgi:hypothetical protein